MVKHIGSIGITLIVLLRAAISLAEEQPALATQQDKVNYGIGVNIISSIKQQGVNIDLDLVTRGMRDAYSGGKLLLNDEELRKAIDQYQTAVRQKRAHIMAKTAEDNKKAGDAFLAGNAKKEGVVTLPSGLQYQVLKAGDGRMPVASDTVECNYRGIFVDGTEFESTYRTGQPATFKVSEVITGWREALQRMPSGSQWRLFIPSQLAYGPRGSGRIGPNAALIFEIDLLSIK